MRRADLADQIDVPDVDAQFQRRGGDERAQPSDLQSRLRVEPLLFRQAAVMRGDGVFTETIAEMSRDALRHAAGVHEDERRLMGGDERRQPVVILLPDLLRHDRIEWRARESRCPDPSGDDVPRRRYRDESPWTPLAPRRNRATSSIGFWVADSPSRSSGRSAICCKPFERKRQVGATPRADDRVDLVDDNRTNRPQHVAAALRREQEVQRLGRGHQDVRRRAQHRRPFGLGRVAGSNRRRD